MKILKCNDCGDSGVQLYEVAPNKWQFPVSVCKTCSEKYKHCDLTRINTTKQKEAVSHPSHYNQGKFETIDVIEDWKLSFNLGNTVKYISRAEHKGNKLEDLEKAKFYLEREITRLKNENN